MTQNPNTNTPAVADLPQRLVDAAADAFYEWRYDLADPDPLAWEGSARAATVAVLETFASHLAEFDMAPWEADGIDTTIGIARDVIGELGDGNG